MEKPYLAATANANIDTEITYPILVGCKFDGLRALAIDGVMYTRAGLPFKPLVQKRFAKLLELAQQRNTVLDGELYNHDMTFQEINSAVSHEDKVGRLVFHAFDCMPRECWGKPKEQSSKYPDLTYKMRLTALTLFANKEKLPETDFVVVTQTVCFSKDEVVTAYERFLEEGFEGVMLRSQNGYYKHGRSTVKERDLRKLKPFESVDAVIVGFKQQAQLTEKAKATITDKDAFGRSKRGHRKGDRELVEAVGSVEVEYICPVDGTKKRCFPKYKKGSPVRTEITWANKDQYLGRWVEVEHVPVGMKDALRFPRIVRFRPDLDT